MKVEVTVFLKEGILDPQGKAVEQALHGLGYQANGVRVGKVITLEVATKDKREAKRLAAEMADKLLANPVIEDYRVELE